MQPTEEEEAASLLRIADVTSRNRDEKEQKKTERMVTKD